MVDTTPGTAEPRPDSRGTRRRFLQAGAALASLGLLSACDRLPLPTSLTRRVYRIGSLSLDNGDVNTWIAAWEDGLTSLGYVQGQNLTLDRRIVPTITDFDPVAKELVDQKPDLILAAGYPAVAAVKQHTATIPIVAVTSDPVTSVPPLVQSLAHPGGNITGLTTMSVPLAEKRVEIFRDTIPGLQKAGIMWNPKVPDRATEYNATLSAARKLGLETVALEVDTPYDFDRKMAEGRQLGATALMLLFDQMGLPSGAGDEPDILLKMLRKYSFPSVCDVMAFSVKNGGMMTYGPDFPGLFTRAATYADKILKGAKPADLPIQNPAQFYFVINQTVAQSFGVTVPEPALRQADQVVD